MQELVPTSKKDLAAAERAVAAGWPAVEPVAPQLLEWLQDINWPVAGTLANFFATIGAPLAPYLRPILNGDDAIWTHWIISDVIFRGPLDLIEELRPELERLAERPTQDEAEEELPLVAAEALARLRDVAH